MAPLKPSIPLPPTTRNTLFLVLDETLMHHILKDSKPPDRYNFATEFAYIIIRPGIDKLLQTAADSDYEIVIFTAGSRNYASPIIDRLDPKGLVAHRLYRDSCKRDKQGMPIKDLSSTGRILERCIMIDDIWQRVVQRENVIKIKPFKGSVPDNELQMLLVHLSTVMLFKDLRDAVSIINDRHGRYLNS